MPSPTAAQRIKEIIDLTRGNRSNAERMIREAIARDHQFLRELVEPFLPGIIAHALSRNAPPVANVGPAKPLPEGGMDALLRGLETNAAVAPQVKAPGQGHADTIRLLAEAQRRRRDNS